MIKMCTEDEKELIENSLMVLGKATSIQIQRLLEEGYKSEVPSANVISGVLDKSDNAEKVNEGEVDSTHLALWIWTGESVEEVLGVDND